MMSFRNLAVGLMGMWFAGVALADHRDMRVAVVGSTTELASVSGLLVESAGSVSYGFSAIARELEHEASELRLLTQAELDVNGDSPDHRALEVKFREVEATFWTLAHTWNANALAFSQQTVMLRDYLEVCEQYTALVYSFFSIQPDDDTVAGDDGHVDHDD